MISYQTTVPGSPLAEIESENPVPEGSEVLVKTLACGVCHSDLHMQDGVFDLGNDKELKVGYDGMVLGHEIFGEVVAMGPDVEGVEIGDKRVVFPWIGCGDCAPCRRGEEQLCAIGKVLGIMRPGGFADHVLVPHSRYLFDKGDVSDALAATYACSGLTAYGALKKLGTVEQGDAVIIIGAGGVGMMAIQIAMSALGINPIVVDVDESKLEAARKMGVEFTFNSSDPLTAKEIKKATGGAYGVLDFVGAESTVNYGLSTLRKGGMLVVIGLFGGALNIPIPFLPMNARIIQGSYVGSLQDFSDLMDLVRAGKIAPIEIHERPLSEASQALDDLRSGGIKGRQVLVSA